MSGPTRLGATLLATTALLAGCHTWKFETLPVGSSPVWTEPVRVYLVMGQRHEFDAARISGDTLFGTPDRTKSYATIAIPAAQVVRVERRALSKGKTAGVVIGSVIVTAAMALAALLIGMSMAWNDS